MDMERIERALDRQARRHDKSIFEPVRVRTLNDIKRVIKELDPSCEVDHDNQKITTEIVGSTKNEQSAKFKVEATIAEQSKRQLIIEGMGILRRQDEVSNKCKNQQTPVTINGRVMAPTIPPGISNHCWVDSLISRWLGAVREGLMICWRVEGYKYEYDVFTHRLVRTQL